MPRPKGNAYLQMKLVYNHFAPVFWFFLQWMDCSCTYLLPRYLNPFHIVVYKVGPMFNSRISNFFFSFFGHGVLMLFSIQITEHDQWLIFFIIQVSPDGKPIMSSHGRIATVREFYGMQKISLSFPDHESVYLSRNACLI